MAAVYNVPLGGAPITAELLYGSLALPAILPALACSGIATGVAWVWLPVNPTYTDVPAYPVQVPHLFFAVAAGPVIGLVSVAFIRLIGVVSHHQLRGALFTPTLATGALLGVLLGAGWPRIWPGAPVGGYALIGAAAMIGAAMQTPRAGYRAAGQAPAAIGS